MRLPYLFEQEITVPSDVPDMPLPRVWCLFGYKAGDNAQVAALADILEWPWTAKHIRARSWELVAHLTLRVTLAGIDRRRSSLLTPPWPDLVLTAGRRNEPVARWIQAQSRGRTRLVHIGRPWAPLASYDLIVTTPQYDLPRSSNIQHNTLPLHDHDAQALAREAVALAPQLAALPSPRIAVLLGGDSGRIVFNRDKGRRLGELADTLVRASSASMLLTSSPRTPTAAVDACVGAITTPAFVHRWSAGAPNPYRGILASADAFIVTAESMSMLAEASAMNRPLYIFDMADDPAQPWWRHAHAWRYKPLSDRIAMRVAPRRMRRDVARIQNTLVSAGTAQWLNEASAAAGLPASASGGPDVKPSPDELAATAARVKALLQQR